MESPESTIGLKTNVLEKQNHNPAAEVSIRSNMNTYKQFVYIADSHEVIGVTHRRRIKIWRYENTAPLSVLTGNDDALECATFS